MATIFVATVRLVHNFKIVANNGHILYNVYKTGSIFITSRRISTEILSPKMEAKRTHGYNTVHKIPWVTKVYTFPLAGNIFGYSSESWTQFIAG